MPKELGVFDFIFLLKGGYLNINIAAHGFGGDRLKVPPFVVLGWPCNQGRFDAADAPKHLNFGRIQMQGR
jgi:hypothetical protein